MVAYLKLDQRWSRQLYNAANLAVTVAWTVKAGTASDFNPLPTTTALVSDTERHSVLTSTTLTDPSTAPNLACAVTIKKTSSDVTSIGEGLSADYSNTRYVSVTAGTAAGALEGTTATFSCTATGANLADDQIDDIWWEVEKEDGTVIEMRHTDSTADYTAHYGDLVSNTITPTLVVLKANGAENYKCYFRMFGTMVTSRTIDQATVNIETSTFPLAKSDGSRFSFTNKITCTVKQTDGDSMGSGDVVFSWYSEGAELTGASWSSKISAGGTNYGSYLEISEQTAERTFTCQAVYAGTTFTSTIWSSIFDVSATADSTTNFYAEGMKSTLTCSYDNIAADYFEDMSIDSIDAISWEIASTTYDVYSMGVYEILLDTPRYDDSDDTWSQTSTLISPALSAGDNIPVTCKVTLGPQAKYNLDDMKLIA
eukprot:sb/3464964/